MKRPSLPLNFLACLWALVALAPAAASSSDLTSHEPIELLNATLLDVMQNADTLGYEGRWNRLAPVLTEVYDLQYVSRIVLGTGWDTLDDSQRSEMVDTFKNLIITTYAARFDGYSGQSFAIASDAELKRGRVLVRTELVDPEEVISLDYILHKDGVGQWRVINVVANGVSDLSVKRAEYSSLLRRSGFPALMGRIREQADQLAKGAAGA